MTSLVYDHADQKLRRRRARITQKQIADILEISDSALSEYELGNSSLPFGLTPGDYENALLKAIAIEAERKQGMA